MRLDPGVVELAGGQHGVVLTRQLVAVGLTRQNIKALVHNGWLRPVRPGAVALGTSAPSMWEDAVAVALLAGSSGALSHSTAATIHQLPGLASTRAVELTVPTPHHPRLADVEIHRTSVWLAEHVTTVKGIRVTSPARTLIDLAPRLNPGLLAHVIDEGCIEGKWGIGVLRSTLAEMKQRKRPAGARRLMPILDERAIRPVGDSPLEQRVIQALWPLAPFETQHQVVVEGQVYLLDIAWPVYHVAVEADGWRVRSLSRGKFDQERRKSNVLQSRGWIIIHATSAMSDEEILGPTERALRQRGAFWHRDAG